jgi:hypothetical protein
LEEREDKGIDEKKLRRREEKRRREKEREREKKGQYK